MKTILLMVHDDPGQESRLQCALDLAGAVEGHLLCLDLVRLPVVVDAFGVGAGQASVILDERDREEAHVESLRVRLEGEGVAHEWARAQGEFEHSLLAAARLVDLVVLSSKGVKGLLDQGDLPARLAKATTAPILVVPPSQRNFDVAGRAVVGWDGSAPAASAIRAAIPVLKLADSVEVVTIDGGEQMADPDDVARYLARHGCKVEARTLPRSGAVGEQLRDVLVSASWGVMGSYGHSRLRERLFGGATHTLIEETPVPLLISH